jgi:hypothetical protein
MIQSESNRTDQNYRNILSHDQTMVVSKARSSTGTNIQNDAEVNCHDITTTNHLTMNSISVEMNNGTTYSSKNKRRHLDKDTPPEDGQTSVSCAINQDRDAMINFGKMNYMECYPNVPNGIYDTYNIDRYMPQIAFEDHVRQLTTGPALLCLLRRGYKVYIKQSDGNLYPCLYETSENHHGLLTYGRRYPSATVCANARLLHRDRVHAPIHTSELSGNIIILTHKYKHCPAKIDAVIAALNNYNDTSHVDDAFDFGDFNGRISIMGSGGSNKVLGNFAPTTKSQKNDPLILMGMGQNHTNPINKKLDELVTNNSVCAVFLNEKYYGTKTEDSRTMVDQPNALRFLGYYQFDESRFVSGDD